MAFRDFFRSDRDRDEEERNRERWRSMGGGEWRDENRGRRDWERGEERGQGYGAERGWSPGSEYYSDRSQDYRSDHDEGERGRERPGRDWSERGSERQRGGFGGGGYSGSSGSGRWDEDQQRYGGYSGRGTGSDVYGRYYGGGASAYTGSGYGGDYSRGAGQSYGEGGYGQDMERGRRSSLGYGGYGGMGGAESGGGGTSSWESGQQTGREQHRGKGPRGYRRSDQRLHEDVCDCLTDDPYIDASNIDVSVKECEVTLSGTVNSREEKRRAEDAIARISGVKDVTNNLRVAQQQSQSGGSESVASPSARH